MSRLLPLSASFALCLALAACGDDSSDETGDTPSQQGGSEAPGTTSDGANDSGDDAPEDTTGGAAGSGTVTVDGVTYSFAPTTCLPDDAAGSSISGAGSAEDGTPVYVDMSAGNLSIYLGTDDPFAGDPDYVASSVAGQGALDETVDGSTVSAQASFTEHAAMDVVAEGSLEATC